MWGPITGIEESSRALRVGQNIHGLLIHTVPSASCPKRFLIISSSRLASLVSLEILVAGYSVS